MTIVIPTLGGILACLIHKDPSYRRDDKLVGFVKTIRTIDLVSLYLIALSV
jgi:hypothetical protein